jgi:hypothetical protein
MLPCFNMSNFLAGVRVRSVAVAALTPVLAAPAAARTAEIAGKLGYLSEWEVTAKVSEQVVAGKREFSGPLTVRHIGLCTTGGRPVEMAGEIRFRTTGWVNRRMEATLVLDGKECGFTGSVGDAVDGVLTCEQWKGVPVNLSIKPAE